MTDEAAHLVNTLDWTCGMIAQSGPDDRERIASAYEEAQKAVAQISEDGGDARQRIVECFKRSDLLRAHDDIACVGWIFTALELRVEERDLLEWRQMLKIVKRAVIMLQSPSATRH